MSLRDLDRALLPRALAQIAQLPGTHDSKTDQTDQPDQRIETAEQFGVPSAKELTDAHQKLTSGTAQRPNPDVQAVDMCTDSALARPSRGAPPR